MVVEDEEPVADDLKKHLAGIGYPTCLITDSAEKALKLFENHHPDLVLMNFSREREKTIIETAEIFRNIWNVPTIFLTTSQDVDYIERADIPFPYGYIIKHFPSRDLKVTIETALHIADIDNRSRKTEQNYCEIREQLNATLKAIPDLIFEFDRAGRCFFCHVTNRNFLHADPIKFNKQTVSDIFPPDAADMIMNTISKVAETGAHDEGPYKLDMPDGAKWFELSISAKGDHHDPGCRFITVLRDITDRKINADKKENIIDHFYRILDYADIMIFTKDLKGRYTFINKICVTYFNADPQEVIGRTDFDLFPNTLAQQATDTDQEVISSGSSVKYSFDMTINREIRFFIAQKYPLKTDQETVYGVCCIATDITERKRAEDELLKSEERFRKMIDNTQVGIAKISRDLIIENVNNAYCRMFGYREDELVGQHVKIVNHPECLSENNRLHNILMAGEIDHFRLEKKYVHKSGKIIYGILDACLVRDGNGHPNYTFGSILDITDRKQVEEALLENEERYRLIWENAIEGILIVQNGYIIFANPQAGKIIGHESKDMTNKPLTHFFSPKEHLDIIFRSHKSLNVHKYDQFYPVQMINKNNELKWISLGKINVMLNGRSATVIFIRDIHEEKLAEDVLRRGKKDLEKIIQKRTAELSNLNLELQQEIIRRKKRENELQLIYREITNIEEKQKRRFAEELHDTLGQYLVLLNSKIKSLLYKYNYHELTVELIQIEDMIKTIIDVTRKLTYKISPPILYDRGFDFAILSLVDYFNKKWTSNVFYDSNIDNIALNEECSIFLYRAAHELILNSLKHSQAEHITATLYTDESFLYFEVKDDGIGFNFKNDGNLFSNIDKGYGLFSLQARANDVHATISITSNNNYGTLVTIQMPLNKNNTEPGD
jgi:PAS domain S-box-containing protein